VTGPLRRFSRVEMRVACVLVVGVLGQSALS
jgi:hypothetical protein